jgi:hypothetical protein
MGACLGGCCLPPEGDELPALSAEEIRALRDRGCLPAVAGPSADFDGHNQLRTVYAALYENGAELTLLFRDEDRPSGCEDCLYDAVRRPLFGRTSDVESVLIIGEDVVFPGTYSAGQRWDEKAPSHNEATIPRDRFEKDGEGGSSGGSGPADFVLWINTWNHLMGEKNNNPGVPVTVQRAAAPAGEEDADRASLAAGGTGFAVRRGSREEVDARFRGLMTSVAAVMTDDRRERMGKRLM